jgi:hypothetical protein
MHGTNTTIFAAACDINVFAFKSDVDADGESPIKLTFWTFDENTTVLSDFHRDFLRKCDGLFTDA